MSFKDDLVEVIVDIRKQHAEKVELRKNFDPEWERLRKEVVNPVLEEAGSALLSHGRAGQKDPKNGVVKFSYGVADGFGRPTSPESLQFSPNVAGQCVVVKSRYSEVSIPLVELDRDKVEELVRDFIRDAEREILSKQ